MKNTVNYNYKLFPDVITEINCGYYFYVGDFKYYFIKYDNDIKYLSTLVDVSNKLFYKKVMVHTFIQTFDKNYFVDVDGVIYVLLRVNSVERDIATLDEVIKFNLALDSYEYNVDVISWNIVWERKVDMFENEIVDLNKEYPLLQSVFNYYVGLAENAISYAKNAFTEENNFVVNLQHKRIRNKVNYGYLYNPLTFTFDYDVRDFAEYIKFNYFYGSLDLNKVEEVILSKKFSNSSLRLLYSRLLYPSYFFDICEGIFVGSVSESELSLFVEKASSFEEILLDIYFIIKKVNDIPPLDWLINKK